MKTLITNNKKLNPVDYLKDAADPILAEQLKSEFEKMIMNLSPKEKAVAVLFADSSLKNIEMKDDLLRPVRQWIIENAIRLYAAKNVPAQPQEQAKSAPRFWGLSDRQTPLAEAGKMSRKAQLECVELRIEALKNFIEKATTSSQGVGELHVSETAKSFLQSKEFVDEGNIGPRELKKRLDKAFKPLEKKLSSLLSRKFPKSELFLELEREFDSKGKLNLNISVRVKPEGWGRLGFSKLPDAVFPSRLVVDRLGDPSAPPSQKAAEAAKKMHLL